MTHCGIDSLLERLPVGAFTHWKAPPLHGSSLRLDACRFDHLAPLLGFVGEELAEFGRRLRRRYDAEVGQLGPYSWIGEGGVDLLVEFVDDFGGRGGWITSNPP